ncbi:MAG: hypothetical protein CMP54_03225 [Flavobacteriales bacterium]|nr:hypothetical protein [Flavobacteriales bacterium]|tara:strand:+ start:145 stop:654 length:510 start_codon:yes stop_codon:yes gene_type:complete
MKNLTITLALILSAFSFAQDKGQYTFGIGTDFTTSTSADNTANVGYFVMDGVMISLEFDMQTETSEGAHDDYMNWGIGARYYIGEGGLWAGLNVNNDEWEECCTDDGSCDMDDHSHEAETGIDISLQVGCSKMLAWDGKLWFEPYFGIHMPAKDESMGMGLGMQFRFAF